jgi:hypothetical protein
MVRNPGILLFECCVCIKCGQRRKSNTRALVPLTALRGMLTGIAEPAMAAVSHTESTSIKSFTTTFEFEAVAPQSRLLETVGEIDGMQAQFIARVNERGASHVPAPARRTSLYCACKRLRATSGERPMSRFAGIDSSDTESSDDSVGEIQETRPTRRWLSDSDSESDTERGRVLSEKERKWNAITAIGTSISNAQRSKDWSRVYDGTYSCGGLAVLLDMNEIGSHKRFLWRAGSPLQRWSS